MRNNTSKVKYKNREINGVAKRMHSKYGIVFANRFIPRLAVKNLSRILERYPQTEEDRLFALECAARIKYEIMQNIDYYSEETCKDPKYFDYKKKEFAPDMAISIIYGEENIDGLPELIERCIDAAYSDAVSLFDNKSKRKLLLNNKKEI